jgi:hypothetical protein
VIGDQAENGVVECEEVWAHGGMRPRSAAGGWFVRRLVDGADEEDERLKGIKRIEKPRWVFGLGDEASEISGY